MKFVEIRIAPMPYGLPWSEEFIGQLSEKDMRDAFVAEQVRGHIAQLIRVLREQNDRKWTQAELAERSSKRQNVISRLENPDEAQPTVKTLLAICAAFDLPLWIDFPNWEDWFKLNTDVPNSKTRRYAFDEKKLRTRAAAARHSVQTGSTGKVAYFKNDSGMTGTSTSVLSSEQEGIKTYSWQ